MELKKQVWSWFLAEIRRYPQTGLELTVETFARFFSRWKIKDENIYRKFKGEEKSLSKWR